MHTILGDRNYYYQDSIISYVASLRKGTKVLTGVRPGAQKVAAKAAKERGMLVEGSQPRGNFANTNEWDIALMSLLLRKTSSAAIFTTFGDSASLYAIKYCQRNKIPFRVFGKYGIEYKYTEGVMEHRS